MPRGCTVLRVFTRGDRGGNHLGVVNDLVGLDGPSMQRIAADLGFSETVFIDWPDGAIPFVRIFTPADELPFAGHPLVGAAWALTSLGPGDMDRLRFAKGTAHVRREGDVTWIEVDMDGEIVPVGNAGEFVARAAISAVESVTRVMLPLEYVTVRLASSEAVARIEPDLSVLEERFGTLVYARDGDRVHMRFFAPQSAVPEDPATGSAAVALATVLTHEGEPSGRLVIDQGEEIGHPSRIELSWGDGRAAIGGTVVRDEVRMLND